MTSLACVAGAIPAAIGVGPGAETRAPMARGIIGGIILSTLVTLVMVPVFYVLAENMRNALKRLFAPPDLPVIPPAEIVVLEPAPAIVEIPNSPIGVTRN